MTVIRKQAPVLVENLLPLRSGQTLAAKYDGYSKASGLPGVYWNGMLRGRR